MMKHKVSKSTELKQQIINDWLSEHPGEEINMIRVAKWAMDNGKWKPPKYDPLKACARELTRAARQEFHIDPQGREVRSKYCYTIIDADGQHSWRWFGYENATKEQMHKSAQVRRRMALGDVVQLATDVSSFNDNNKFGAQIDMSFNFDEDLEDMAQSTEYPEDEGEDFDE